VRRHELCEQIIIVDGIPGSGKTMLSPIIASLGRVEIANYAFEIEYVCRLYALGNMTIEATVAYIRMLVDNRLYTNMMSRDVNFRYADLSSVFNTPNRFRYFKRAFAPGDLSVLDSIAKEKPILNLTTHDLFQVSAPVFEALHSRLTFINVVRHPAFVVIQQLLNLERLLNSPRDIQIYFDYQGFELPYFAAGWEELFLASNNIDRVILTIWHQERLRKELVERNEFADHGNYVEVPFEKFVKNPSPYLESILKVTKTKRSPKTSSVIKGQKVPRKNVVDGVPLEIYRRCGWEPPEKGLTEMEECEKRRQFIVNQGASSRGLEIFDQMSEDYLNMHGVVFSS
jgi:hypothetical protein